MTEDEMVGWHHWLNGHVFGQTPGVGDGQGGLVCCGSWGRKELDMTELNWVKAMVFPVVIYGRESWTTEKDECQRIDGFELWCWRRLLRVPWTARRSNQFILKEISPDYSLEGLMLNLKLQYFGHLMWRTDSLEKTLIVENTEYRRRGREKMRWYEGITNLVDMSLGKLWELIMGRETGVLQIMGSQRVRNAWVSELN